MKIFRNLLLFLMALPLHAQHSISGSFTPAKDFTWVIAYRIKPGTQAYIADTTVKDGKFTLSLPLTAAPGTYRLVYAVPQDEFYFDVLFDGKEDIQLNFNAQTGPSYIASEENKIYDSYFKEITAYKQLFIDFYADGKSDVKAFKKLIEQTNAAQATYEESTKGMLVHEFILANRPYVPADYESSEVYWQNKKDHYFDYFDLKNPVLQESGFLPDRVSGFVFTAITKAVRTKAESESIFKENIEIVSARLQGTDPTFKQHIFYVLWNKAASKRFDDTADFIYNNYLKALAKSSSNQKIIDDIEVHNRLRLGAQAPEITWNDGTKEKKLSEMGGADCYVLIFWSSTCSHCLKELPPLHKKLADFKDVKVLAVGLEDDKVTWLPESAKFPNFVHAIALGRWENGYAKTYAIQQTPTYFILDKEKHIIAKPLDDKGVIAFLEGR